MSFAEDEYILTGEWLTSCNPVDALIGCTVDTVRPFVYPTGIAVDSFDDVYIVDLWTDTIQKFTSDGKFMGKWGSSGSGDGQLRNPKGIAIDSSDNVYVLDQGTGRIQKFTSDGKFITKWGARGFQEGQFQMAAAISVDLSDNIYVVDQLGAEVLKFTSDGKFITKWGAAGNGDGQFRYPKGVAVDPSGNVFVVDQYNNRIQKFSSDGKFITKWGSKCLSGAFTDIIEQFSCPSPKEGEFFYPDGGIEVDVSGNVFVADSYNNRIQKFTNDGEFITQIQLPDYRNVVSSYSRIGPSGLTINSHGQLFSTALNDKVLIYSPSCPNIQSVYC